VSLWAASTGVAAAVGAGHRHRQPTGPHWSLWRLCQQAASMFPADARCIRMSILSAYVISRSRSA
jgi:hypothetical protein